MDDCVGPVWSPLLRDAARRRWASVPAEHFQRTTHAEIPWQKRIRIAQGAQTDVVGCPAADARQAEQLPARPRTVGAGV
ncbi:MAG: hypothetical protein WAU69_13675, partial [Solirubrobacteraceae bacterium]